MMSHIRDFSRFLRISSTAAALATHPPAHDRPSRPSNAPPRGPRSPPVAWRAWGLVPHILRPLGRPSRPTLPPLPPLNARCPAAARGGGGCRSPSFATASPACPRCIPKPRGAQVEVPVQAEGTRGSERVGTGSQPQRSRARASQIRGAGKRGVAGANAGLLWRGFCAGLGGLGVRGGRTIENGELA